MLAYSCCLLVFHITLVNNFIHAFQLGGWDFVAAQKKPTKSKKEREREKSQKYLEK